MIRILKTALVAAALSLGALGVTAPTASADTLRIEIGNGLIYAQSGHRGERRHHHHRPRACTPNRAVEKAWRMGINRPHVTRVNRNTIRVAGFQRGHKVRILFARARNCPVIR